MPKLIRPPVSEIRSRVYDAARWRDYKPRASDIVIATYAKCGTTWMQRIVSMLVFASAEPRALWETSLWPDARFGPPLAELDAMAEAQTHRRFLKTHLPLTSLPFYESVKYVHVARDGRDACMSLHNHLANFSQLALSVMDDISMNDPLFGDPFPRAATNPSEFFCDWINNRVIDEHPEFSYFGFEQSYWEERQRPNVLLVHYNDLKADRAGEMRRIAKFLDIDIPESLWPELVEAASFESMKRDGETLLAMSHDFWDGGPARFLHKGTNNRWHEVARSEDLAAYDAKIKEAFTPELAKWAESGRLVAGDPRAQF
ncbi:MAG: sulfotransferase domain-containing protein [Gallionella sp.]|nr:sulfotransferase domain-containing protein [Gallionella sp.]